MNIVIHLPRERDFAGTLALVNDQGETVAGPFAVCGRASDRAAAAHGNPGRLTTMPYGDTPLGTYRMRQILPSGRGTTYGDKEYGPHGVVVLDAVSGDAALAEAAGRFHIFIQGGVSGPQKRLLATNGCLRLSDADQKRLVRAISDQLSVTCDCSEAPLPAGASPIVFGDYNEGDPPPLSSVKTWPSKASNQPSLGRRNFLRGVGIAASAFAFSNPLFVTSALAGPTDIAGGGTYNPGPATAPGRAPASAPTPDPAPATDEVVTPPTTVTYPDDAPKPTDIKIPDTAPQVARTVMEAAVAGARAHDSDCSGAIKETLRILHVDDLAGKDANQMVDYMDKHKERFHEIDASEFNPAVDGRGLSNSQVKKLTDEQKEGLVAQRLANTGGIIVAGTNGTSNGHVNLVVPDYRRSESSSPNRNLYPAVAGGAIAPDKEGNTGKDSAYYAEGDKTANQTFSMSNNPPSYYVVVKRKP